MTKWGGDKKTASLVRPAVKDSSQYDYAILIHWHFYHSTSPNINYDIANDYRVIGFTSLTTTPRVVNSGCS